MPRSRPHFFCSWDVLSFSFPVATSHRLNPFQVAPEASRVCCKAVSWPHVPPGLIVGRTVQHQTLDCFVGAVTVWADGRVPAYVLQSEAGQLVMPCLAGDPWHIYPWVGHPVLGFHCGEVNTCSSGYVLCSVTPTGLVAWALGLGPCAASWITSSRDFLRSSSGLCSGSVLAIVEGSFK